MKNKKTYQGLTLKNIKKIIPNSNFDIAAMKAVVRPNQSNKIKDKGDKLSIKVLPQKKKFLIF